MSADERTGVKQPTTPLLTRNVPGGKADAVEKRWSRSRRLEGKGPRPPPKSTDPPAELGAHAAAPETPEEDSVKEAWCGVEIGMCGT